MKIYKVSHDSPHEEWTLGYFSTLEKAIDRAEKEVRSELEGYLIEGYDVKVEELRTTDTGKKTPYGKLFYIAGIFCFGIHVNEVMVDDT